ncbi:hypothetical protein [Brachybacterium sp. UMB0905]|uniref:hypothetical protein n=1 Tax=Brachybacterium sp. UMB0905 TaxID=2069310 RepID=UPI000C805444|nr:hypothetical protein [Brachybacterium sp. UMB0905]PMC76386.1 hypothetical protein CJ197_04315 [Brachybacterium sp. UMB0905]
MTTPNTNLAEQVRTYLEEVGLTDRPEEYGDGIHGWRCELPDLYGRCDCLDNVVADLVNLMEAAVKRAQAEALRDAADDPVLRLSGHSGISITRLRARADLIKKEAPDEQ